MLLPDAMIALDPGILVVDDEEKLGRFICMLLKRAGYRASTCCTVADAQAQIKAKPWNLVITDVVLPYENGFELVRWLGDFSPGLTVIVMTAHSTDAIKTQASQLGVAAILHKPFTVESLCQTVAQAMQPVQFNVKSIATEQRSTSPLR